MESLPNSIFLVNNLPDFINKDKFQSYNYLMIVPFCLSLLVVSPLLILLFVFCSFIRAGGGGGRRGGIFALEICFFVGVTKECT